jgi:DNA primase
MLKPNHTYGYDAQELGLEICGHSGNNELIVRCPNPDHNDTNPSACFNSESGLLFCFSCSFSCNASYLAGKAGVELPVKKPLPKFKSDSEELWRSFNKLKPAFNNPYLKNRGVTDANVLTFDIRESNKGVVFLFKDYSNHLVGAQLRQYEGKPKYLTFGQRIVYPEYKIPEFDKDQPIYLTEGVFGAIRGYNAGLQTLAVIGAMVKRETVGFLNNWSKIYGLFDNDLAGYIAGARLLKFVPRASIIIPGAESDELNLEEWRTIASTHKLTRSIKDLAELSGDSSKFYKYIG